MKKWSMDVSVLLKNLNVIAENKVEAMEKARKNLQDTLRDYNIDFEESSIKVDEKSISMQKED